VEFNITISKKHLYIVSILLVLFIGVLGVDAYTDGAFTKTVEEAQVMGHSADEIVIQFDGEEATLQDSFDRFGTTYTRWGNNECPTDTEKVYSGWASGSHYTHSGTPRLSCMPTVPEYGEYDTASEYNQGYGSDLTYAMQIRFSGYGGIGTAYDGFNNHVISCAVCYVPRSSSIIEIPAMASCPTGWTEQYDGYIFGTHAGHSSNYEACIDDDFVGLGNAGSQGGLMYPNENRCNNQPWCEGYERYKENICIVCSK